MSDSRKSKTDKKKLPTDAKSEPTPVVAALATPSLAYVSAVPADGKTESAPVTLRTLASSLTVEMSAYILLALVAVVLRFSALDFRPLSNNEAAQAVASYHFVQTGAETSSASPFLFTANAILFFLFGANDFVARLVPALFGVVLVLLPLLLRRELGRTGALVASALLLLSPTLTLFAHQVEGNTLAVIFGLAALIFFQRYRETNRAFHLYATALCGAMALTSGAVAYTILLGGALWFALDRFVMAHDDSQTNRADSRARRNALILFALGLAFWSTTMLLNRRGLGDTLNLFGDWLNSIKPLGALTSPLNLLISYEPLILVFGIAGLIYALTLLYARDSSKPMLALASSWVIVGIVLYSFALNKAPESLAALVVPFALLAGWFIGELIERAAQTLASEGGPRSLTWKELPVALIATALTAYIYLLIAQWLAFGRLLLSTNPASLPQIDTLLVVGLFVVALVIVGLLTYSLMGGLRGGNFFALLIIFLLALATIRGNWLLNFSDAPTTNDAVAGSQTSFQINDLVKDLQQVSEWRANDPHTLTIQAQNDLGPVLAWYLRVFPNTTFVANPSVASAPNAIITDAAVTKLAPDWISQTYRVESSWRADNLTGLELWRWFVFRQGGTTLSQSVKLWILKPQ